MSGIAARRISQPAFSSATACRTLPSMSLEGTFSIDCTVTGAPPPILTPPAETCFEIRFISPSFPGGHAAPRRARASCARAAIFKAAVQALSARHDARDVVERDRDHQAQKQHEAARVHPALVPRRNRPPKHRLN